MKMLALIIIVWLVALYAIISLSEHHRANGGLPVVKSAAPIVPRHIERLA